MRARLLLLLACLWQGCASCDEPAPLPPRDVAEATVAEPARLEPAEPSLRGSPASPTARPADRARTVAERIERLAAQSPQAREQQRARSTHLREGRRLGRAGDHAAALAEFEAALQADPHDATVLCEAGYQALQLHNYGRALEHLMPAVGRAAPPRTRAMCLYNLGRVREEQSQLYPAEELYEASLDLRENRVVRARLAALTAQLDDRERREDEGEEALAPLHPDALVGRVYESLDALIDAAGCGSAGWAMGAGEARPVPHPSAALRELSTYECDDDEAREVRTFLLARSDDGWMYIDTIGQGDMGDTYGRLEATERLEELRFEGARVLAHVIGSFDEPEGEAEAYWDCERESDGDDDRLMECFEAGHWADVRPERWDEWHSYVLVDGHLVIDPDPPDFDVGDASSDDE